MRKKLKIVSMRPLAFLQAAILAIASVIAIAPVVYADSTLCSGSSFSTCINAKYTAHGYENHYQDDVYGPGVGYWKAYNGHNCTNYVGYMLHINGDSGHGVAMGNASGWDDTIAQHDGGPGEDDWGYTMDTTPAVGAIAQWEGGFGHVAYVEAVNAAGTTIVVSEDNAPQISAFRWRSINTNGDWPTRFLHIKDKIVNQTPAYPDSIVVRNGTNLFANTNATSAWEYVSNTASANYWKVSGSRIVNQDTNGLWVKDGSSNWARWGNGDSDEIQVSPSRIVVRSGSNLYANTSATGTWEHISNSATAGFWKLSGDRVVNQDANGLWVKDGAGSWTRWGNGDSDEIQVSPSRIVVRNGSNLYMNTSSTTGWELISASATAGFWKLNSDRIVNQDTNGLWVKDGSSGWTRWGNGDSDEIQVSPSRIVVRNGTNLYSNSAPNTSWEHISNSATAGFWKLSGNRVTNQDTNGLWVKDGSSSWVRWGNGDSNEIQIS